MWQQGWFDTASTPLGLASRLQGGRIRNERVEEVYHPGPEIGSVKIVCEEKLIG